MLFSISRLSGLFTENQGNTENANQIAEVSTDSRKKMNQALFVPIVGEIFDGHNYILQAIEQGAIATLWDKKRELPEELPADLPVFFVEDTIAALQQIAEDYRWQIDPLVIGITGSNGKTTTKDMVRAVVETTYRTHYTKGNLNNHIGLPLTILSMKRDTEVLVLEMGMNQFGEIETLSKLSRPDYAIITNIGESHIEFLGSREGIAKAKLEILHGLRSDGQIIIDGDERLLEQLHGRNNVISCGYNERNDKVIEIITMEYDRTDFKVGDSMYTIPLLGKHHVHNASYAIALGELLNIKQENMQKALRQLSRTSMRFEMIKGANGSSIINDAYNASPTSMKAAIDVVKEMDGFHHKILVLGDILELGVHAEDMHRSVAENITVPITAVFTYGDEAGVISESIAGKDGNIYARHFTSKEALVNEVKQYLEEDSLLLFKASRGLEFEKLIEELM
ncbi:UDP-N-acetylmuramoyl-tripeptide--D-alanyl-D-alanine ligase [Virgibacillus sp. YIM 98842]|uniref:UDP-N-acetylmuramoyl-tripeptide--D-alanyl-D- alanine ligase n=1 Tax=Virgibacillus sp. YIM 98842 TaxID=2663533 RepID=UPI0013DAF828|nr:UDP-N-acetylmuramoyl-tripeptide--D-alanyl-D-alanine ligase [Virgibacillus sp. YIM 98842]